MTEGYFSPWRNTTLGACRTCQHAIGTPDGWHLWCARHRIVVVFPCARWEREPGADEREQTLSPDLALRLLEERRLA